MSEPDDSAVTADDLADAIDSIIVTRGEVCVFKGDRDSPAEYATTVEDRPLDEAAALVLRYRAGPMP